MSDEKIVKRYIDEDSVPLYLRKRIERQEVIILKCKFLSSINVPRKFINLLEKRKESFKYKVHIDVDNRNMAKEVIKYLQQYTKYKADIIVSENIPKGKFFQIVIYGIFQKDFEELKKNIQEIKCQCLEEIQSQSSSNKTILLKSEKKQSVRPVSTYVVDSSFCIDNMDAKFRKYAQTYLKYFQEMTNKSVIDCFSYYTLKMDKRKNLERVKSYIMSYIGDFINPIVDEDIVVFWPNGSGDTQHGIIITYYGVFIANKKGATIIPFKYMKKKPRYSSGFFSNSVYFVLEGKNKEYEYGMPSDKELGKMMTSIMISLWDDRNILPCPY